MIQVRIRTVLTVLCCWTIGYATAQRGSAEFESIVHDFGQIQEDGGLVIAKFPYKNVGNDSLAITDVKVGCGCTTPNWPKSRLGVNNSAFVTTAFDPKGRPGVFEKRAVIYTDGKPAIIALTIRGEVLPRKKPLAGFYPMQIGNLRVSSTNLAIKRVGRDKTAEVSLGLLNPTRTPIALLPEKFNLPSHISVSHLGTDTLGHQDTTSITFAFDASQIDDWGPVFNYLDLATDDPNRPQKRINLIAHIVEVFPKNADTLPRVHFDKKEFDFGEVNQETINTTTFTLTNIGDATLQIHKAKASCGCTTGQPDKHQLKPGEHTEIEVTFNSGMRNGQQEKYVTIICNDPKKPETNLIIRAHVKPKQ